ncbi:MAG: class I SAM-dependent methyltransferase [Lentisphaeria bacterium]|nr:class I SAM-dependent methyltransferase [Lentisphaeria bacterium]
MSLAAGFNRLAPFYDILAQLGSFGEIKRLHSRAAKLIFNTSKVLVIGGGTGHFAKPIIEQLQSPTLYIDWVDFSEAMLDKAKKNLSEFNAINYYHQDFTNFLQETKKPSYDLVISCFALDIVTPQNKLNLCIQNINYALHHEGSLLLLDFKPLNQGGFMQKKLMLKFFEYAVNSQLKVIPNLNKLVLKNGFKVQKGIDQRLTFAKLYKKEHA